MTLAKYSIDVRPRKTGWLGAFYEYIDRLTIDSKETGTGPFKPYLSQKIFLEQLAKGIDEGVHSFCCLKSRQLGVSTAMLPIDVFWGSLYPGTQGAIVVDEEANREAFRNIIDRSIHGLPRELKVGIAKHNRDQLVFKNGSAFRYLVAGTRKKGTLGVGGGYNFVHATECSKYGDPEAWSSFLAALAEQNPHRLFVYESTARGFNLFRDMWLDAIDAPDQRAVFIGWWAKEIYRLKRNSQLFNHHFDGILTDEEIEKITLVKQRYGVEIDDEQIAWYRYTEKRLNAEGGYCAQEHPWHEQEAFLSSGKMFFPNKHLTLAMHRAARGPASDGIPFKGYRYNLGEKFEETKIEQILDGRALRQVTLRIWEEPDPHGVYAVGADPAYGDSIEGNEWRDRFSIQVLRCYADRVVQVAEFADDELAPHQFAWVLAHLAGAYRNTKVCLEINGPGVAVVLALNELKEKILNWSEKQRAANPTIEKLWESWSWYLYRRIDSLGGGYMMHFKSDSQKKTDLMFRFKDALMVGLLDIRSVPLIEEMQSVISKEGWVGAEGRGKDDRALAFALAYRAFDEMIRKQLTADNRTYDRELAEQMARENEKSQVPTMVGQIVKDYFRNAEQERLSTEGTVDAPLYG